MNYIVTYTRDLIEVIARLDGEQRAALARIEASLAKDPWGGGSTQFAGRDHARQILSLQGAPICLTYNVVDLPWIRLCVVEALMDRTPITLHLDRDRVHAGDDDFPGHTIAESRTVPGNMTIGEAVDAVTRGRDRYPLASIVGGATWVLYGGRGVALAVITYGEQREEPRMVADPDLALATLAGPDGSVSLHFHCFHQDDPQQTWQRLRDA
ncbi:hypothetical protein ACGFRG_36335 [Streptomyces sp. NPDC048696]|uniref:hypothetical protein n=1 Tax=Streptomyces sp. NPDC048696 TaxID=3365585 RepID=UPI003719B33C